MSGTPQTPVSDDLFGILSADTALADIVGDNIFPLVAPSGTPAPWVVYQRISVQSAQSHDGATGFREYRFQISAYSQDEHTAESIREVIMALLDGQEFSVSGQRIVVFHENDSDDFDEETRIYSVKMDFMVQR